jgi:hypothetical protein
MTLLAAKELWEFGSNMRDRPKCSGCAVWGSASPLRLQQPSGNYPNDRRDDDEYLDT